MDKHGEIQFFDENGKRVRARRLRIPGGEARVTYALVALNVAMFAVELACGAHPLHPRADVLVRLGADVAPLTLHGEPWRLVTSMFLHFGVVHLAMNMLCLYQARSVEPLFGSLGFVAIYLAAGLGGSLASSLHANPLDVGAGASGAVFGVIAAFGVYLLVHRSRLSDASLRRDARWLAIFFLVNLVYGATSPTTDLTAHLGGLVAGGAAAFALTVGERAQLHRVRRAIAVASTSLAVTVIALVVVR